MEIEGLGISKPATNFFETGVWHCPAGPYSSLSYGYNAYGAQSVGNYTNALGLLGHYSLKFNTLVVLAPISESEVANPSDMMAIGENFFSDNVLSFMRLDLNYLDKNKRASSRHQGKANVVFCDGHVESPTLQFLFEDTGDEALSRWNRDHEPHREELSP